MSKLYDIKTENGKGGTLPSERKNFKKFETVYIVIFYCRIPLGAKT